MNLPKGSAWPVLDADFDLEAEVTEAYYAHSDAVYRVALRAAFGDREVAMDCLQDVFMEAVATWGDRRLDPGGLRSWLCNRARWRIIDKWRRDRKSSEYPTDPLPEQPDIRYDEDAVLADISVERFWHEITCTVPIRAARAAFLRWNLEWKLMEIADFLTVERTTVTRDLAVVRALAQELTARNTIGNPGGEK